MARIEFLLGKLEELGRAMGAAHVWRSPSGAGAPGAHHEGGTRMGSDAKTSVVNRYGQSWDIPNLWICDGSVFPTVGGVNPSLTIQAIACRTADRIRAMARRGELTRAISERRAQTKVATHAAQASS